MTKTTDYSIETTELVARAFGQKLKSWLSVGELLQVLERNKAEESENICHSHDFCDANMAMEAAFKKVLHHGCRSIQSRATEEQKRADDELWNEAWALAKSKNFFWV